VHSAGKYLEQKIKTQRSHFEITNKLSTIPTTLMGAFIQQMQAKLLEKKIGQKQEFIKEIVHEVRIRGREATLTYKLPLQSKNASEASGEGFLTPLKLVGPPGLEPGTYRL
jgi:hypothetical protein